MWRRPAWGRHQFPHAFGLFTLFLNRPPCHVAQAVCAGVVSSYLIYSVCESCWLIPSDLESQDCSTSVRCWGGLRPRCSQASVFLSAFLFPFLAHYYSYFLNWRITALQCFVGLYCIIRWVSYKGQCISMLLCLSKYSNRASLNSVRPSIISSGGRSSQKTRPTLKGCFKCREIQVVSLDSLPSCAEYVGYIPTLIASSLIGRREQE